MLKKRLDYGFNGYQLPSIPKGARSARRRGSTEKKVEDKQMCAFDLLATIAGNLLLEGEVSQNTSLGKDQAVNTEDVVMEEQLDEVNPPKVEHCDHLSLELGLQAQAHQHDAALTTASVITSSDCLVKDGALDRIDLNGDDKGEVLSHSAKVEQCSENGHDSHGSEDVKFFDKKPPETIGSDSSFKLSLGLDHHACGSVTPSRGDNVKVVTRDDDENSSGCTHPSTVKTMTRWPPRIGGRKIRKPLASKYRRVAPKVKDGDLSDTEFRYIYCSRKSGYRRQRSQRIYPFKKRKIFQYRSLSNSDRNVGCKAVYSPDKGIDTTAASFGGHRANGSSSSVTGQSTSFPSRESHVKVRVKSFRVPELFIEMPETATIGSLKRTVMEALTALIGGGLHVGVLLQGKKIRDDNRTLLQSGICRNDKVESLGFTLEPKSLHASPPFSSEDNSLVLSTHVPEPVSRCLDAIPIHHGTCHPSLDQPMINVGNLIESDHDSAPSPAEISVEKGTVDSRALVALPEETPQALAVVPAHHKSKRSEMAQRRIRRPFSVTEVESLVEAVEKLGTGRWRDVKLRAFDNVKHRTYVDLKDKWKTLVHTARISPQQRRGEPVPQELLDRVLGAHAYWSQHQAKQQLKQQPETCLLL